ncbi:MAG: GNAT family N-acetyltransferase [Oscillospiraceae bacterium]|nr:GNAT family N-acetyltransferase [Oscillospiraceae bacterium]
MIYPKESFTGKNGVEYILRSPEALDAEKMIEYLKATADETEYGLSYPEEMDFTVQDEEAFISNYSDDKGSLMISVFRGDKLVGNASLSCVMDKKKVLHRASFGMAILKSDWGQGLGGKILSELISYAKMAGYEYLELEVASSNYKAVSLYKKMGFAVYGERSRSLKLKSGEYYDELLMTLKLNS